MNFELERMNANLNRIICLLLAAVLCLNLVTPAFAAETGDVSGNADRVSHTWDDGVVTVEPTCTASGTKTYTCTDCGETKTEAIPATGHTDDGGKVTKAATCTENGEKTFTCTVCKEVIKREAIPATGHAWNSGYTVDQQATYYAEGSRSIHCSKCGAKKDVQSISKLTITIAGKDSFNKNYSNKAQTVKLGAKASLGKLSYKSGNKKYVTVDKKGKVTIKAKTPAGVYTITVTAKDPSGKVKSVSKKIKINVLPTKSALSKAVNAKGRKMTVNWKKNTTGNGYQIQYSTDKHFKKGVKTVNVGKNKTTATVSKLNKGKTYYVRIRTKAKGNAFSAWSKVKSVKIKK